MMVIYETLSAVTVRIEQIIYTYISKDKGLTDDCMMQILGATDDKRIL